MDKLDLIVDKIDKLDETVNFRLDVYNKQLEEHIEGVNTLKKLHNNNVSRIETLEEPRKVLSYMKKTLLGVSAIVGAVLTIVKLFESGII